MANDPAFLFYPGDYLRDTQCLSEKSQVAYDRIMCEHMRNICISQEQLNFFTKRLSEEEKKEVKMLLVKTSAGYQIQWVAESISKRKAYSDSRRKNKEGKTKNISKSYDSHMDNEIVNEDETVIVNMKGGVGENRKTEFLTNQKWKEEFCQAKGLQVPELEILMKDFVSDCDLKGKYIDSYQNYFLNLFNKKQENVTHQRNNSNGSEKLGTSEARIDKASKWGS